MAKLKKANIKHRICNTCNGNGYVRLKIYTGEKKVFQCWNCDSEGEFYETVDDNLIDDGPSNKLH